MGTRSWARAGAVTGGLRWGAPLWLASLVLLATVPFGGDERPQVSSAAALAAFLRGELEGGELLRTVVGFGWFMPGMALVVTPLHVVWPEPPVAAVRTVASLVNLALFLWALIEVGRGLGRRTARILWIVPGLVLAWFPFTSTLWGDLPAGTLLTIAFVRLHRIARDLQGAAPPDGPRLLGLAGVLAAATYFRGSLVPLALAVQLLLFVLFLSSGAPSRTRGLVRILLGALLYLGLLAPWSLSASAVLGAPVLVTTSVPLSIVMTFGSGGGIDTGGPNRWMIAARRTRERAREEGRSELAVQRELAAGVLAELSPSGYARQVRRNFKAYLGDPAGFVPRFLRESALELGTALRARLAFVAGTATALLFYPALLVLLAAFLVVLGRSPPLQLTSLLLKLFGACLLVQPFVNACSPRYWPTLAPLFALALAFLLRAVRGRRVEPAVPPGAPERRLRFLQALGLVCLLVPGAAVLLG